MKYVSLGRTQLHVPQLGFGALPIQRVSAPVAVKLIRKAFDSGIRYFDTARAYSDSEEKLGASLAGVRQQVVIATKTLATDAHNARLDLETSLSRLRTDYIDIIQLHNPEKVPDPADESSAYAALAAARREGLVRFIGVTNHRLEVARAAVVSGLFDTLQFPLSHISSSGDLSLIELCKKHDVGIIAMKALCGGLLTNIEAAFTFFRQLHNVVPIWGIQHEHELYQFLRLEQEPPQFTCELACAIEQESQGIGSEFLSRLRILPSLRGRDPHTHGSAHVIVVAACPVPAVLDGTMAAEHAAHTELYGVSQLCREVPLRLQAARASQNHARGLRAVRQRTCQWRCIAGES